MSSSILLGAALVTACALATAGLIVAWKFPETSPTSRGGGVVIVIVTIAALAAVLVMWPAMLWLPPGFLATMLAAATVLTVIGAIDDAVGLSVRLRLVIQIACAVTVVASLPDSARIVPGLAIAVERAALVLGLVWFVNLTNFMDGLDWLSIAGSLPILAALAVLGVLGEVPVGVSIVALALGGSIVGFAPFNRPVAKLFLGDAGSLPIGLVLGALLVLTASAGHVAAAILLPLYSMVDTTLTLVRRLIMRERIWEAHRTHFYQRAVARGFTVPAVVARVATVDLVLAVLAVATVVIDHVAFDVIALACGAGAVARTLRSLSRGRG